MAHWRSNNEYDQEERIKKFSFILRSRQQRGNRKYHRKDPQGQRTFKGDPIRHAKEEAFDLIEYLEFADSYIVEIEEVIDTIEQEFITYLAKGKFNLTIREILRRIEEIKV
jgi:nicotinic acid phosphoribosyltransferase